MNSQPNPLPVRQNMIAFKLLINNINVSDMHFICITMEKQPLFVLSCNPALNYLFVWR